MIAGARSARPARCAPRVESLEADGSGPLTPKQNKSIILFMERIRPLQQDRAGRTAGALARAAHELMQERPFDEVPVTEIVRRAGVSVGAFYARFGCKEALLDWLCQDRLRREAGEVRRRLLELERSGAGLRELVEVYVDLVTDFYRRNAVLLREVVRLAYGTTDEEALSKTLEVSSEADRDLVEILLARRGEIGHPEPERAVALVPAFVAAMLRTFILLHRDGAGPVAPPSGAIRREEMVEWILAALRATPR